MDGIVANDSLTQSGSLAGSVAAPLQAVTDVITRPSSRNNRQMTFYKHDGPCHAPSLIAVNATKGPPLSASSHNLARST